MGSNRSKKGWLASGGTWTVLPSVAFKRGEVVIGQTGRKYTVASYDERSGLLTFQGTEGHFQASMFTRKK